MNDEERYSFDLQGFLVRRAVLTAAEVRAVNAEIDAQAYPSPDDTIAGQRFAGFLGSPSAPVATSLMDHSAVIDVVREVNGPNARLDHSYGIYIAPGTRGCGCMVAGLRSTRRSTTRSARDASTAVLSVCSGPWSSILPVVADSAASLARTRPTSYVHRQSTTGIQSSTKWRCRRATW